jgi:hypothetical protein
MKSISYGFIQNNCFTRRLQLVTIMQMKRYESWKGPSGNRKAKLLESELREKLGRDPTKRDFQEAGIFNVWMVLYRKRKIIVSQEKECARIYRSIEEGLLKSNELMERMIWGLISTLGPEEFEKMVDKIRKKGEAMFFPS